MLAAAGAAGVLLTGSSCPRGSDQSSAGVCALWERPSQVSQGVGDEAWEQGGEAALGREHPVLCRCDGLYRGWAVTSASGSCPDTGDWDPEAS